MTSLATLGEKAKIWEVPTFQLVEQFNPYDDSITDLTWSHDGHSIACCSSSDTSVHLRSTKDTISTPSRSFQLQSECLSLDFNSDSRFLLCGCVDGTLHIHDRKSKSISKSYKNQTSPVTAVRWNWNNNNIAAGNKNGEIILYNIVTGQSSRPLVGRSTQAIQQLKYNPYKKAMLVATSDDGAVNLWDTNTRRLLRNFDQTHHASAKDVAFSPINDIFMVSVGLDKKAVFYNLENKTAIQTIVAEHPLTCVDVLQDGTTVAVGTMHGQVFFYDMRKSSIPVFNFTAHRTSVKRLSFVRKESKKGDSTAFTSAHSTSDSLRRQLPRSPAESNLYNGSSVYSPRGRFSKSEVDIFSPLGHGNKSNNSVPDMDVLGSFDGEAKVDRLAAMYSGEGAAVHGLFSPVKANLSQSLDSTGGGHMSAEQADFSVYLAKVLGSAENSLNKEVSHHSIHKTTFKNGDLMPSTSTEHSIAPEVPLNISTGKSPPRQQNQHGHYSVTFDDRPSHTPSNHERLRSSSSPGGQSNNSYLRLNESAGKRASPRTSVSKTSSPPRYSRSLESPRAVDLAPSFLPAARDELSATTETAASVPLSGAEAAASNLNNSVTASLRNFIQELLHEQLQAHQAHLQSEIRAMMSGSGLRQTPTKDSKSVVSHNTPESNHILRGMGHEISQAELVSKLVSLDNELDDLQDWMSNWFRSFRSDNVKMTMRLERIEALLEESIINPALLEEIAHLREENARLRRTF